MRKFLAVIASGLLLAIAGAASPAVASDVDVIHQLDVLVNLNADGTVSFTETIEYEFSDQEDNHGIYRDLPTADHLPKAKLRLYDVSVTDVTLDGSPVNYENETSDENLRLKIGDADTLINGTHTYVIKYEYSGALHKLTAKEAAANSQLHAGDIDFYWDVVGFSWEVPIEHSSVQIVAPSPVLAVSCTYGPAGSTQACPTAGDLSFNSDQTFTSGSGMTVAIQLAPDGFTAIPAEVIVDEPEAFSKVFLRFLPFGIGLAVALVALILVWARRRWRSLQTVPVTESVRFDVPTEFGPGEASVALNATFNSRALAATLLDLAVRKQISLEQDGRHSLNLKWLGAQGKLAGWEEEVMRTVFQGQPEAQLKKRNSALISTTRNVGKQLLAEAQQKGRRNAAQNKARLPFILLLVLLLFLTFGSLALLAVPAAFTVIFPAPLAATITMGICAMRTPLIQTQSSAEFVSQMNGLRRALDTEAAESRRKFALSTGFEPAAVFATMLPWAVIFSLEETWSSAFPDVDAEQLSHTGLGYLTIAQLNSMVGAVSAAATSSMASASGSDGGSSGGGGGGGGGGGW